MQNDSLAERTNYYRTNISGNRIKLSSPIREVHRYKEHENHDFCRTQNVVRRGKKLYPELGRNKKYTPIKDIAEYLVKGKANFEKIYNSPESILFPVEEDDFEFIRFIGKGAFSIVNMVRKIDNGLYYARKEMRKNYIFANNKMNEVKSEKRILKSLGFPFIVNLKFYYQDYMNIHFIMPLMIGGELYIYMKKFGRLKEEIAQFLLSQLILALEYLHFLGLIHRDLKLENILIDHVGYIKLGDFGMCKYIKHERTFTICGTAEYLAPEVINHCGYGLAADWWSFGIITYELCSGSTPFVANEFLKIFHLITNNKYVIPKHFSYTLADLIGHLLEMDPNKRYGNLENGVEDVKGHAFFKNINWIDLINRKIDSPMLSLMTLPDNRFFEPQNHPPIIEEEKTKFDFFFNDF